MYNSGECNIYVGKYNKDEYKLYDITSQMEAAVQADKENGDFIYSVDFKCEESNKIEAITDISKHSIVIFEGQSVKLENYMIYREFNYVVSRIVYDIKLLNNNILPRINLIGHSRGGLTNIEYALDHPDLVNNVFSMGTPYCGSTTASIDYALGCPIGDSPEGEYDIITESKYMNYLNSWNDNYEALGYDKINVYALGGYATIEFYKNMISTDRGQKELESYLKDKIPVETATKLIQGLCSIIEHTVLKSYCEFYKLSTPFKIRK